MKALSLTATLLAAAVMVGAGPGTAADLDYQTVPPPDRFSSAYEDPRYRDIYGPGPGPRAYVYAPEPRFQGPPPYPVPPGYVYKDGPGDRYGHDEGRQADDWRYAQGCLPRGEIKRRLVESGWRDFFDLDISGRSTRIKARRPDGDLYALKIDRCSGDIIRADLIERGGVGPYAYRDAPRRFERPYY